VLDSRGLILKDRPRLDAYKVPLARDPAEVRAWDLPGEQIGLLEVVRNAHPTVLYGVSGQPGTITEAHVAAMSEYCLRPVIFPMSNPTESCEATPGDILAWSEGRAIVATGSPFAPVDYQGRRYEFSQANNVAVFPGVGMGALISRAQAITPTMLFVAGEALHAMAEAEDYDRGLVLPPNRDLREVAVNVAAAVAERAWAEGVAQAEQPDRDLREVIREQMYVPRYRPLTAG